MAIPTLGLLHGSNHCPGVMIHVVVLLCENDSTTNVEGFWTCWQFGEVGSYRGWIVREDCRDIIQTAHHYWTCTMYINLHERHCSTMSVVKKKKRMVYHCMHVNHPCPGDRETVLKGAMSGQYVTANGFGSVRNVPGVNVSVNTGLSGLIPGSNVSACPILSAMTQTSRSIKHQATTQLTDQVISEVFLKAVSTFGGKKASSFKTFMLRNSRTHLKELMFFFHYAFDLTKDSFGKY